MPENELGAALGHAVSGTVNDTVGLVRGRVAKYQSLPLLEKNRKRASYGTGMLTACYYIYLAMPDFHYGTIRERVTLYIAELYKPFGIGALYYAWGVMLVVGAVWLVVGLLGSRGPRDMMAIFWALTRTIVFASALWFGWFLGDLLPGSDWLLQGIYIAGLTSSSMLLFVNLIGPGGRAARIIARLRQRRAAGMRPASSPGSGFWAEMRDSFERGRTGR